MDNQRKKPPVDAKPVAAKRPKGGNTYEPLDGIILGTSTSRGEKDHSDGLAPPKSEMKYIANISSSGAATRKDDRKKDIEKSRGEMTEEEKSIKRRAANRISAFKSRQRRINMIEDLQSTAASISKDNQGQRAEIESLKEKLAAVQQDNTELRCALMASRSENTSRCTIEHVQQALEGPVVAAQVAHSEEERNSEIVSLVLELDRVEQQIQLIQQHAESSDGRESDASLSRHTSSETNPPA